MSEQAVLGLRERKKQATRVALAEAALRLSVEHGTDTVTVEQIADAADVSVRTFFNYFSAKEEAIVAGDVDAAGRMVEAFRDRPAGEPLFTALRHALLEMVDDPDQRDRITAQRGLSQSPSLLAHRIGAFVVRERALAEAVAERIGADPDRDVYPSLVAASAMAGLRVAVQRWPGSASPDATGPDLADLVGEVLDLLSAGLLHPPAR
ncbi:TetR family transcriptional regulator [Pseudonocardia sediminis]|uniref:TetR family transcriptional regulator n=1 Tax=Pseudonocardia sediminis TaxID=1397368 RepID=A0A4Q7UTC1_PSEST|nr:TetR family transcriptional regulator [Pseudonocardia sediminis]RZT84244.1 TetR family transcriptional regulator [Pseudonocardia sediminis]